MNDIEKGPRVDTRHPQYEKWVDQWRISRDAFAGESCIKLAKDRYLPKPTGQMLSDSDPEDVRRIKTASYKNYVTRASFPDLVYQSLKGLLGIIERKPHRIELPRRLQYLEESATSDGLSLRGLISRILEQLLLTGRVPVAVDFNQETRRSYFVPYQAESLINWRESVLMGQKKLSMSVMEMMIEEDSGDPFAHAETTEWQTMFLEEGRVVYRKFRKNEEKNEFFLIEEDSPTVRDNPLTEIPLVIFGPGDISPDVERPPLLGIAETALSIYRGSADYEQALFMTAQPTHVITGMSADDDARPTATGAGTIWIIPDAQAKAMMLEFSGAGVAAQRQSMLDKYSYAVQQGVGLVEPTRNQAESGEAIKMRQSTRTSVIHEIVNTVEQGLKKLFVPIAAWQDADPDDVVIELNKDFFELSLSAQELQQIVAAWQAQAISRSTLFYNLQKGEIIPPDADEESELALIEQDSTLMGLGNG